MRLSEVTSLRILFVTGEYPPMQGGVADYTQALGRALVALGHQVGVLTSIEAEATAETEDPGMEPDRTLGLEHLANARRPRARLATTCRPYSISNRGL